MEKNKILIIESNLEFSRSLERMLEHEFKVVSAKNGVEGIEVARKQVPNIILMDVDLPVLGGYDVCSILKSDKKLFRIPIIFLSEKNSVADVTRGLSVGADDYLSKPFDFKELDARIKARLRKAEEGLTHPISVGKLEIDLANREVIFDKSKIHLTLTEFDILRFLAARADLVVTRDDILKEVWKEDSHKTSDRTIDVHIRALRRKIPPLSQHILSIYGVGYKYEP